MYPRFSQTFIVNEILGLERHGADVRIVSLKRPTDGHFHESISRVRARAEYLPEYLVESPRKFLKTHLAALRKRPREYLRALGSLLRHSGNNWTDFLQAGVLLAWAKKNGAHHFHVHFGTHEASVAYLAHLMGGLSYSMTLHAFDIFRDNVDRVLLAQKINASRFTVTVSEYNRRFMLENLPGLMGEKVRVSYNGIDLSLFDYNNQAPPEPLVVAIGRLIEKKGFLYLVRALGELREKGVTLRCEIVGDGPEQAALTREIKRLKVADRVRLVGPLEQHRVRELLQRSTCMALPCVVAADGNVDALPTVLLEAMAAGCPCVSTRVSGVPEILVHEESGLLVEPSDVRGLAAALARIVGDAALRQRLSQNARRRAEEHFNLAKNVGRLASWLADAVQDKIGGLVPSPCGRLVPAPESPLAEYAA